MHDDLAGQLAALFRAGLEAEPGMASDLASSLSSFSVPPDSPDAEHKLTKAEANYRKAESNAGPQCGNCRFYDGDGCTIVSGPIDRSYVSDYYHPDNSDDVHAPSEAGMED